MTNPSRQYFQYVYEIPGSPVEVKGELARKFASSEGYSWLGDTAVSSDSKRAISVAGIPLASTDPSGKDVMAVPLFPALAGREPKPGFTLVWVSEQVDRLSWWEQIKQRFGW